MARDRTDGADSSDDEIRGSLREAERELNAVQREMAAEREAIIGAEEEAERVRTAP